MARMNTDKKEQESKVTGPERLPRSAAFLSLILSFLSVVRPASDKRRLGRAVFLWWLAGFCFLQLGLAVVFEVWRPEFRDPEYGKKLAQVRDLVEQAPDRPLVLVLGSSRVLNGVRPNLLPALPTPEGEALVYNFGLTGAGPLHQLLTLRRLLDAGIRPRWIIMEILPATIAPEWFAEDLVKGESLSWHDFALVNRYSHDSPRLYRSWLEDRSLPWFTARFRLLSAFLPHWAPDNAPHHYVWNHLDSRGWLRLGKQPPQARQRALQYARTNLRPILQAFHIGAVAKRALPELLELCHREKIRTAFLLMPEGPTFRSWYPPQAENILRGFLRKYQQKYKTPLIDARTWVPEEEFLDSHHLLAPGAARFTHRLGDEGLRPLFE
jgi:hypothetical protein